MKTFVNGIIDGINAVGKNLPGFTAIGPWNGVTVTSGDSTAPGSWGPSANSGGAGAQALASGSMNFGGGPAIIGERGRELYHDGKGWNVANQATLLNLPKGATVLPNHATESLLKGGVPGFADGLNLGSGALGELGAHVADYVKSLAGQAISGLTAKAGGALFGAPNVGGGMNALRGLITMEAGLHEIPIDLLAAIVLQESSGVIGRMQDGGGLGRGLMQVDLGQHPEDNNAETIARLTGTTMDDARFQMEEGIRILGDHDWSSKAAQRDALFHYNGGESYPDTIFGLMPQFASWMGGAGNASGGFANVVQAALAHQGETFHADHEWNMWCEQFAELAGEDAGYPHLGWASALAHAQGVSLQKGVGPAGSTMLWGDGYDPSGHAAISLGDGTIIGTTPRGIQITNAPGTDYRGWAPPGLATGAYVTSPMLAQIGEGSSPEIVAPEPVMRQIVREEGGATITVNFGEGSIVAPPGTDPRQFARDVVAVVNTELDKHLGLRGR